MRSTLVALSLFTISALARGVSLAAQACERFCNPTAWA